MPPTTNLRRGDVVRVLFRNLDPKLPSLPVKGRPALVIQNDQVQGPYNRWVMASFTTNVAARGKTRIFVEKRSREAHEMGLTKDCLLCLDDLETIPPWRILQVSGSCPFMDDVDPILRNLLEL
jgi:mRNA-degrading endonuclease toxin of MazEF toxin-antitoxin module